LGKTSALKVCAGVLSALLHVTLVAAQYGPQDPRDVQGALTSSYVKTGLYVISGGGGNTVLRLSGNGLILVNGKEADHYDELLRRVRKIVDQPIRVEINTDHYASHNGTNAKFTADGVQVVAQQNVARHLLSQSAVLPPPAWTYENEKSLQFGLVQVQLLHFGEAHTDGDSAVFFPDLKAIAVGCLYSNNPIPDYSAGGSLVGWKQALTQLLKLDFDAAIPDLGPPVSRADVERLRDKLDLLISRGSAMAKDGISKDQFLTRLNATDLGLKLDVSHDQLDAFYRELATTN
jgi:glyoxylase-like metal-dependent hydrolase (beta-lactamase superfamily II)